MIECVVITEENKEAKQLELTQKILKLTTIKCATIINLKNCGTDNETKQQLESISTYSRDIKQLECVLMKSTTY